MAVVAFLQSALKNSIFSQFRPLKFNLNVDDKLKTLNRKNPGVHVRSPEHNHSCLTWRAGQQEDLLRKAERNEQRHYCIKLIRLLWNSSKAFKSFQLRVLQEKMNCFNKFVLTQEQKHWTEHPKGNCEVSLVQIKKKKKIHRRGSDKRIGPQLGWNLRH